MATQPAAVALQTAEAGSGRRADRRWWGGSQVLATPRVPAQREARPAAAVLQDAGSRQLGWEPFVLREVCEDKQPLIIGYFIRAAATHQLLTQCLSEGPPLGTSQAVRIELDRKACLPSVLLKGKATLNKACFSKQLFVGIANRFSKSSSNQQHQFR